MDGDGELADSEVTAVSFVCNGNNALVSPVLVKLTAEAAGANCVHGGQRIDTGADDGTPGGTANNSVLETPEIDATPTFATAPTATRATKES